MTDQEEIEIFVAMFEVALRTNNVPEGQWKAKLHSHLTAKAKLRIQSVIQDHDSSYNQVKEALLGCSNMTFSAAAESLMSAERGRLYTLDYRQCEDKLYRLMQKVCRDAVDIPQALGCLTVAFMRYNLSPSLKTYIDLKEQFDRCVFSQTLDEWELTQPVGTSCFRKQGVGASVPPLKQPNSFPIRKPITCFHCGNRATLAQNVALG